MSMIQCPACRGAKEVRKLGNMIGACNTCVGKGVVESDSLPKVEETAPLLPTYGNPKETAQHYVKIEEQGRRDSLKNANVAFLNQPITLETKKENVTATHVANQRPAVLVDPKIKQSLSINDPKAPKPISPDSIEAAKIRNATVERSDSMMAAQTADLNAVSTESENTEVSATAKGKSSGKKSKSA